MRCDRTGLSRCIAHNTLAVATARRQSIARQQMAFDLGKNYLWNIRSYITIH